MLRISIFQDLTDWFNHLTCGKKHLDDPDSCIGPVFSVCGIREVSATHYSQPGTHLGVCHKFRQFEVPSRSEFHNKHVARWKKSLRWNVLQHHRKAEYKSSVSIWSPRDPHRGFVEDPTILGREPCKPLQNHLRFQQDVLSCLTQN